MARALVAIAIVVGTAACDNGNDPTGAGALACLTAPERDLVTLINKARADSGRAPLAVDTRLIQASRLNASRIRDDAALDSLEWGSTYGVGANAVDLAWGYTTASAVWTAWMTDVQTNALRQTVYATVLGNSGRLLGVARDTVVGGTADPRWWIMVSTSGTAPVTTGSCAP